MSQAPTQGTLVLVSAPSGGGKNAVIRGLLQTFPHSIQLVTTTTRPPRPGEKDGVDYYFLSRSDFEEKLAHGEFVEHNEYAGNLYGTQWIHLRETLATHDFVFSQAEVNGKQHLDDRGVEHVSVFLLPESLDILKRRIQARGGVDDASLEKRLSIAKTEIAKANIYDLAIVNEDGKLDQTVAHIAEYLTKHRG